MVVIGILIALSINNWNEKLKKKGEFDLQLVKVKKELSSNVSELNDVIEDHQYNDSVLYILNNGLLTSQMLEKNNEIIYAIYNYDQFTIKDAEFMKLSDIDLKWNMAQDSIITALKNIYEVQKTDLDKWDDRMGNIVFSNIEELSKSKNWFHLWNRGDWTSPMKNYFLKESLYLNNVANYSVYLLNDLSPMTVRGRNSLVDAHRLISRYLNEKDTLLNYDVNEFKHYIGLYEGTSWSLRIENKDGKLFNTFRFEGEEEKELITREIFPITKTCYTTSNNAGFFYLRLDENKKVDKLDYSSRQQIVTRIKIE